MTLTPSDRAVGPSCEVDMRSRTGSLVLRALLIGLAFAPASTATAGSPATKVTIDATAVGEPISSHLYGQFIEHLGRCIYGGLWAEMLEDRKFYYPVTGKAPAWEMFTPGDSSWEGEGHPYELLVRSPWLILGEKAAVSMVREGAYAGEHSPQLALPGGGASLGLMQERLGLVAGREYVGRIVLASAGEAHVEVSLAWGGGAGDRQTVVITGVTSGFATYPLRFRAGAGTDNGRLEIVGRGTGTLTIGAVSLMPADNVLGWRADTLAFLRELNAPVYRWPGGNFVSGYDWKDGLGDPDRRPPRQNPAWKGTEPNDVGLHEFVDLCRLIDAEPYVAVNTGKGGPQSAAELVEYANGAATTPMGRQRAANGATRPFGLKLWAVGNEMYGDWQIGHVSLEEYVAKHKAVVDAMRAVDPSIRAVAVGAVGEWSRTMLRLAATHMSSISEHLYWQSKPDVPAHVAQVVAGIRHVAEAHRGYRRELPALADRDVRVALDEWNYWYGPYEFGELGTRYFLQDALGIAAGLHELFRQSDIFWMANYAQTVNVIGAIKTTPTAAALEPTGQVLALYRHQFGTLPLKVALGADAAPLDVAAALTADGDTLTVAVVNPSGEMRHVSLDVRGLAVAGRGQRFVLTGADRWSGNRPGGEQGVAVTATSFSEHDGTVEVPALSVVLERLLLR
jgi:alpha-L-arabinofuranosidase